MLKTGDLIGGWLAQTSAKLIKLNSYQSFEEQGGNMKSTDVRIHIGTRSMIKGEGNVHIEIEDISSGVKILDIEMTLSEYGKLVAGNGYNAGVATCRDNYSILGKKKEVKSVQMPKNVISSFAYGDDDLKSTAISAWCEDSGFLVDGWDIWDSGLRSQQNGEKHKLSLYRYVEAL